LVTLAKTATFAGKMVVGAVTLAPGSRRCPDRGLALEEATRWRQKLWSKTDSTSYFKDYVVSPAN
jgi:hypothetical protein